MSEKCVCGGEFKSFIVTDGHAAGRYMGNVTICVKCGKFPPPETPTTPAPVEPEEVKAIREAHERDLEYADDDTMTTEGRAYSRCATLLNLLGDKEGWRDIGTAPKDGTRFLAFQADRESQRYECWWQEDFANWEGWQDDWDNEPAPTHWMPLPIAPSAASPAIQREG